MKTSSFFLERKVVKNLCEVKLLKVWILCSSSSLILWMILLWPLPLHLLRDHIIDREKFCLIWSETVKIYPDFYVSTPKDLGMIFNGFHLVQEISSNLGSCLTYHTRTFQLKALNKFVLESSVSAMASFHQMKAFWLPNIISFYLTWSIFNKRYKVLVVTFVEYGVLVWSWSSK